MTTTFECLACGTPAENCEKALGRCCGSCSGNHDNDAYGHFYPATERKTS